MNIQFPDLGSGTLCQDTWHSEWGSWWYTSSKCIKFMCLYQLLVTRAVLCTSTPGSHTHLITSYDTFRALLHFSGPVFCERVLHLAEFFQYFNLRDSSSQVLKIWVTVALAMAEVVLMLQTESHWGAWQLGIARIVTCLVRRCYLSPQLPKT